MRRASSAAVLLVAGGAAIALVGPAASKRRPKPPPCPGASYVVDPPLVDAGGSPAGAFIRATSVSVAIDGVCDAIPPKRYKTTRTGTKVKAKWQSCAGLNGKVKLVGKVIDECGTFKGKVRAKKFKRRIEASRAVVLEAAATIGAAGGQVVSGDGKLTLDVPAGALSADTEITIRSLGPSELAAAGADAGYVLGPDGQQFSVPVLATFAFDPDDPVAGGVDSDLLLLVSADAAGENPEVLAEQTLAFDAGGGTASVAGPLTHFSTLRIFRPRDRAEAQGNARIKVTITPGVQLQTGQIFTVGIEVNAGLPQRNEKQIMHRNTVPAGDRVVYTGSESVLVATIGENESKASGIVTGYACGPVAGFGTYSAVLTAEVEPSFDLGLVAFGGSVSLTTDLRIQIGCSAPTTTSTSATSTTSTSTSTVTVSSTSSTSTSSTTTTSTSTTTTTSSSTSTTTSTTTTTLPEPGGCCECGPGVCASGPAIGVEDCPVACAPMSGTFKPTSECNLTTGSCDLSTGRAVLLTHTIGPFEMGTPLCLHLVRQSPDGCIGFGFECLDELMQPAAHLHRMIEVVGVGTGIADPIPGGCGHGRVVEGVPGCLPENPIVPNCQ